MRRLECGCELNVSYLPYRQGESIGRKNREYWCPKHHSFQRVAQKDMVNVRHAKRAKTSMSACDAPVEKTMRQASQTEKTLSSELSVPAKDTEAKNATQ